MHRLSAATAEPLGSLAVRDDAGAPRAAHERMGAVERVTGHGTRR